MRTRGWNTRPRGLGAGPRLQHLRAADRFRRDARDHRDGARPGRHLLRHRRSVREADSERFLGKALGARRDEVVIATKWGWTTLDGAPERRSPVYSDARRRAAPTYIRWALEQSLRRLGTDWIDVYQYHKLDGETPLEETFGTLASLVREGRSAGPGSRRSSRTELEHAVAARPPDRPSARQHPAPVQPGAPGRRATSCSRSASGSESAFSPTSRSKAAS